MFQGDVSKPSPVRVELPPHRLASGILYRTLLIILYTGADDTLGESLIHRNWFDTPFVGVFEDRCFAEQSPYPQEFVQQ